MQNTTTELQALQSQAMEDVRKALIQYAQDHVGELLALYSELSNPESDVEVNVGVHKLVEQAKENGQDQVTLDDAIALYERTYEYALTPELLKMYQANKETAINYQLQKLLEMPCESCYDGIPGSRRDQLAVEAMFYFKANEQLAEMRDKTNQISESQIDQVQPTLVETSEETAIPDEAQADEGMQDSKQANSDVQEELTDLQKQALDKMVKEMQEKHSLEEERVHNWLSDHLDDALAEGILKDGRTIAQSFEYCTKQAQKQAKKGASFAMVDDETVFSWVKDYFIAKDNPMVATYKKPKATLSENHTTSAKKPKAPKKQAKAKKQAKPKAQDDSQVMSIFDFLD